MSTATDSVPDGLRSRKATSAPTDDPQAAKANGSGDGLDVQSSDDSKDSQTYGRTPDGTGA
jgi:hypothetical protein